ncbi:hypothetical protein SLS62_004891 [Diatrype stigma]|uniref:Uncharacterized protein n=1 Tax=Diatrype stigma TaxID=117547 RepID=A0AAN9V456_9PEZI
MELATQIIYGSCWVILALYMLTTALVFTQRSCISYAASFLFACALWVDLTLFNFWFLLPTLYRHLCDLEVILPAAAAAAAGGDGGSALCCYAASSVAVVQSLASSAAMEDLALMLVGWLASAMSISNSFDIWQRMELYLDTEPHCRHGPVARRVIWLARRVDGYVGIEQTGRLRLPDDDNDGTENKSRRMTPGAGAIFAVPRWTHKYMMMLLSNALFAESGLIVLGGSEKKQAYV